MLISRIPVVLVAILIALFVISGCGGGTTVLTPTQQAVADVATPAVSQQMIANGGGITSRLQVIPTLPAVQTLIAAGTAGTLDFISKYAGTPDQTQDDPLLAYSYVLAQTKDNRAINSLIDFLSVNITGEVIWSLYGATTALKVLTEQTDVRPVDQSTYTPLEILDTITRAKAWLTAHPDIAAQQLPRSRAATSTTASGWVRIILTNATGDSYYWNDNGTSTKVTFELSVLRSPAVPSASFKFSIPQGGGTFVSTPEGDENLMGGIGICGGYGLREMLRFSGNTTTQGGWLLSPDLVFRELTESGILTVVTNPANAKVGDVVFWKQGAVATHAAIIQSIPPDTAKIVVRNKDERSGVFTANIDADYYNHTWAPAKAFGTPVVYTYTNGEKPTMLVDTSLSNVLTPVGNKLYLQDAVIVVK